MSRQRWPGKEAASANLILFFFTASATDFCAARRSISNNLDHLFLGATSDAKTLSGGRAGCFTITCMYVICLHIRMVHEFGNANQYFAEDLTSTTSLTQSDSDAMFRDILNVETAAEAHGKEVTKEQCAQWFSEIEWRCGLILTTSSSRGPRAALLSAVHLCCCKRRAIDRRCGMPAG